MHGASFFSFHFLSISFPKINHFCYFTSLHGLQDVKNHCAHLRDITVKTGRTIPYLPMYYSLCNEIGEHEITKLKKRKKIFASNLEKRDIKQAQKDMNEIEWHKMDYLIFTAMCMRKLHLFCTSSHHNVPYEKQQELNKGLEMVSLVERVRNC